MKTRAVFLDRDGVLNRVTVTDGVPHPPQSLGEFEVLPGVDGALQRLLSKDFELVVVTNQPDVARGVQRRSVVEAINHALLSVLPLREVRVCYHDDGDGCDCRKPRPGMLLEAARELGLDLDRSYMIGDRWRDIEAGRAAGCETILIERTYSELERCNPRWIAADLVDAVDRILQGRVFGTASNRDAKGDP